MLEPARLTWNDWLNHRCLLEPAGTAPPAKVDANQPRQGVPWCGSPDRSRHVLCLHVLSLELWVKRALRRSMV